MSADQTYVRGIVRVVTKGGTITELLFAEVQSAIACDQSIWAQVDEEGVTTLAIRVADDFGHTVRVHPEELAMTVLVDLRQEIDGAVAKAWENQKGQDRHNERLNQRNSLLATAHPLGLPTLRPMPGR